MKCQNHHLHLNLRRGDRPAPACDVDAAYRVLSGLQLCGRHAAGLVKIDGDRSRIQRLP